MNVIVERQKGHVILLSVIVQGDICLCGKDSIFQ
jgi:hypothetical protein